jgi:hypothetical protein
MYLDIFNFSCGVTLEITLLSFIYLFILLHIEIVHQWLVNLEQCWKMSGCPDEYLIRACSRSLKFAIIRKKTAKLCLQYLKLFW